MRWMEEEQRRGIGKRLRELRENSPETNRSIGDAVGVSERTVAEWIAGRQGMTYDHAQAIAKLFEVDLDWFWRGKSVELTPDLMADLEQAPMGAIQEQLDRIEAMVRENRQAVLDLQAGQEPSGSDTGKRGNRHRT